jgi:hypothetical protein
LPRAGSSRGAKLGSSVNLPRYFGSWVCSHHANNSFAFRLQVLHGFQATLFNARSCVVRPLIKVQC